MVEHQLGTPHEFHFWKYFAQKRLRDNIHASVTKWHHYYHWFCFALRNQIIQNEVRSTWDRPVRCGLSSRRPGQIRETHSGADWQPR